MTGIVDVGGGMRGVFSAGIYDRFIEEGINFDLCIGLSLIHISEPTRPY